MSRAPIAPDIEKGGCITVHADPRRHSPAADSTGGGVSALRTASACAPNSVSPGGPAECPVGAGQGLTSDRARFQRLADLWSGKNVEPERRFPWLLIFAVAFAGCALGATLIAADPLGIVHAPVCVMEGC